MPGLVSLSLAAPHPPTRPLKSSERQPEDQESPRKETAMADLRLASIDRAHIATEAAAWNGRGRQNGYQRQQPRKSARERLISVLAPGRQPETCEVDYVVDGKGMMVAVLVRDVSTGEVIARINAEDLWQLGPEEAAGGLLLERRG